MVAVVAAKFMKMNLVVPQGKISSVAEVALGVVLVMADPGFLKERLKVDFDPRQFAYSNLTHEQVSIVTGLVPGYKEVLYFFKEKLTQFWSNYEGKMHVKILEKEVRDWSWVSWSPAEHVASFHRLYLFVWLVRSSSLWRRFSTLTPRTRKLWRLSCQRLVVSLTKDLISTTQGS